MLLNQLVEDVLVGAIDLDEVMVVNTGKPSGVKAEHLAKVWKISLEDAERTLDVTSQHQMHTANPKNARNYGTNDKML